ncbi:NAD(P)-binding protein [Trichodelitschia bisporula]|uniref:Short-chain dehydrogenase/reductase 3 n=1 Tax=Trichodelitschia bisporula TaxID=703511 RepID=A0A6G1I6D5_9PEZI|nr:NAD(P)-binding protein [Trichodelitschia bisporula]
MSAVSKIIDHGTIFGTASCLIILAHGPDRLRDALIRIISKTPFDTRYHSSLKWILGLGFVWALNRRLNAWALNNWQLRSGPKWKWDEEVAVVTGGSNGIGALTVAGLAAKGIKVAVMDISSLPEELQKLSNVKYFKCNIAVKEEVDATADAIRTTFGHPSILLNNAGIADAHTILESTPQYLRKLFDVNVLSNFYTLQAFLPHMVQVNKGHVVTTASMASFVSCPGLVDYSATKAGVLALHEGLTSELKHRYKAPHVRTSSVHPIFVSTKLVDTFADSLGKSKAVVISPQTVANAIVKQVLSGQSGQVVLPGWMAAAQSARGWPNWMQELMRDGTKNDVLPAPST